MISLMSSKMAAQLGLVHILPVFLVFGLVGILTLTLMPIHRTHLDGKQDVKGVMLAKGGDESGSSGSSTVTSPTPSSESHPPKSDSRLKYEIKDDQLKVRLKTKSDDRLGDERENEVEDKVLEQAEKELGQEDLKVATAPGQFALVSKNVGAITPFPLTVDLKKRSLTVTTPSGTKTVTVLPDQAINNLLASKVITDVNSVPATGELASINRLVEMELRNGVLSYRFKGVKKHHLFGLVPINTQVESFVSAENGQVTETTESLLGRLLNRIAPQ